MAKSKLMGWTYRDALKKSASFTHISGVCKLSDGSYAALRRIALSFSEDRTTMTSAREYEMRDGTWVGQWMVDRGWVAEPWIPEASTKSRTL